jgi:hypothetical protein
MTKTVSPSLIGPESRKESSGKFWLVVLVVISGFKKWRA